MKALIGIGLMVYRSLRQHALSSCITAMSVALACGLLMSVFSIKTQTYEAFTASSGGFDAVLGARGSQLQLVLNSIYHMEKSTGNLPWRVYAEIARHPMVAEAIPIAVGDNYRGFRIVGVTGDLFDKHEYAAERKFAVRAGGRFFDSSRREAVIGSFAAAKTGLKVGDTFNTFHGLTYNPAEKHADEFLVVGILEPTNTPFDRVMWIPLEGYYRMAGHALFGTGQKFVPQPGQAIPDEHKEVSAVLLTLRNPAAGFMLRQTINNQGNVATLAWPIGEIIAELFGKIAWVNRVLELVAYLVIVVAAGSILASIYNTMNERRREFAILRALGARRATVFSGIVLEAAVIALLGTLLGYLVYAILLGTAGAIVRSQTGVVIDVLAYHPVLLLTPVGMTVLGALAGVVPAVKAYGTDVATYLAPTT